MTLRWKIPLVIGATLIGLVVILYVMAWLILMRGFNELEEQDTRRNTRRAVNALAALSDELNRRAGDYAAWDDTCKFVEDPSQQWYVQSNMTSSTFTENRINFVLLFDRSRRVVFSKGMDLHTRREAALPKGLLEHLSPNGLLLNHRTPRSSVSGILLLPEGPVLIASRPVVGSDFEGPVRGTLIMGRYLDIPERARLAEATNLSLYLLRYTDEQIPSVLRQSSSEHQDEQIFVSTLSEETIAGYALLQDIYGRPGLVLRVEAPRDIYKQGRSTVGYFVVSAVTIGIVFAMVTLTVLEDTVLARLAHLSGDLSRIAARGDLSARVPVTGRDELASLANEINSMLAALENSRQIRESEERYRRLFDEALTGNYICTPDGKLLLCNLAFAKIFGFASVEEAMRLDLTSVFLSGESWEERIRLLNERGELRFYEHDLVRPDGQRISVVENAVGRFDDQRRLVQVQGYLLDITERREAREKLMAYQEQLRSLASEIPLVEERERRRIATELHDRVTQTLALCKIKLGELREWAASPDLAQSLAGIHELLNQTIRDARSLIYELSPPVLYEFGFVPAVEWLAEQIRDQYGVQVECEDDGQEKPLDDDVRVVLFQSVRELLVNVAKHSNVDMARVSVQRDRDEIRVTVEDKGIGFEASQIYPRRDGSAGFGLFNIRERLTRLSGRFAVESKPGQGTRVTLWAPLRREEESG